MVFPNCYFSDSRNRFTPEYDVRSSSSATHTFESTELLVIIWKNRAGLPGMLSCSFRIFDFFVDSSCLVHHQPASLSPSE